MSKRYTDEELISELHRFVRENGRAPTSPEMTPKNGYPSHGAYEGHFGSYNNALLVAGYKLNQYQHHPMLDGTETCSYCGKRADEIVGHIGWCYHDRVRYCRQHGTGGLPDYIKGELDINSTTGLGRAGEILVVKTLDIGKEHDCNRQSCNYSIDMYHKDYGKIDVKTSLLSNISNSWFFTLNKEDKCDTYICVGLSSDRSIVEHVWVIQNKDNIRDLTGLEIRDTYRSLLNRSHWEVDAKPYNDMWQSMKLDNCKIMVDKSKDSYNNIIVGE